MKSAIEKLIFDNNVFMEKIPFNDTYWQLLEKIDKLSDKLKKTLNKEQTELFNKIIEIYGHIEAETNDSHLLEGFKTGVKLMIECS